MFTAAADFIGLIGAILVGIVIYIYYLFDSNKITLGGVEKIKLANVNSIFMKRMEAAEKEGPVFSHILDDTVPEMQYARGYEKEHRIGVHWGQRKLHISEMEVLNEYYFDPIKRNNKPIMMIYVGSAPGDHLPLLSDMYPEVKFILYDPRDFNQKLYNSPYDTKFNIHQQLFMDADAKEIAALTANGSYFVIFVSDIRSIGSDSGDVKIEEAVKADMKMQADWVKIIRPDLSVLKFRLSYYDKEQVYLSGDIHLQAWAPITSTETRLWVKKEDIDTPKTYYPQKYNNQMYYFNRVKRHLGFAEADISMRGYDKCHDCALEISVLKKFAAATSMQPLMVAHSFNKKLVGSSVAERLMKDGHGIYPELSGSARFKKTLDEGIAHVQKIKPGYDFEKYK